MAIQYLNLRSSLASDPIRNFRFIARFTALATDAAAPSFDNKIGFMSIQGLNMQTEAIPYREGGYNTVVHYLPGQQTFSPVTFQRGVTLGSRSNWDWFRKLFDPGTDSESGLTANFRCKITVDVLGHPQPATRNYAGESPGPQSFLRFTLLNAWPTNISYSDLNAADNAVVVEQLTVVHEGLDVVWSDGVGADSTNPNFPANTGEIATPIGNV